MRYTIERAYGENGPDGWDLFESGVWANRFPTREQARAAKRELESRPVLRLLDDLLEGR